MFLFFFFQRRPVAVFYNILDLAGINARILFKEHQQQESPEESPAAAGRGAEGRIHGRGNRPRQSAQGGQQQMEPDVGHLKCHKPVCGTVRGERR